MTTGGASCPIEVIHEVRARLPGHLLELYGMLECGFQSHTSLDDDPEEVCGLVGRPLRQMGIRVVGDDGSDCPPGTAGEILTSGPSVTIGYYNSHDTLDRDKAVQEEMRNVARAVVSAVQQLRAGTLSQPDRELHPPRPK